MQSLVPSAIAIIKFGAKGENCAVAKYKTTKVAERLSILAVNSIFFALASFAAVFQCIVLGGRGENVTKTLKNRILLRRVSTLLSPTVDAL